MNRKALFFIGMKFRFTPAKGENVNIYRETVKCPECSMVSVMLENVRFVKADVAEALISHSYAFVSVVAWVMYQKYAKCMPLYR